MLEKYPETPDGKYFVVRGRLWRKSNPQLAEDLRAKFVADLMAARRAVQVAIREGDADALIVARARVNDAKIALGERGPVWWSDGSPDLNQLMVANTPYRDWYDGMKTKDDGER